MASENIVEYKKATKNAEIFFLIPREDDKTINSISKNITNYIQQKIRKSEELLQLINNHTICRSKQILRYFNETSSENCNMCDVCLAQRDTYINLGDEILAYLKENQPVNSIKICLDISATQTTILVNLQQLLAEEKIAINDYNQYYINS